MLTQSREHGTLIDARTDQEHEEGLVEFLKRFFDDRPGLDRTIKLQREPDAAVRAATRCVKCLLLGACQKSKTSGRG